MAEIILREGLLGRAGHSFIVTLPAAWIRTHRLHKRSVVTFAVDDAGRLIITPARKEAAS